MRLPLGGAARAVPRLPWQWVGFPTAVLLIFLTLAGLNLNGSSISLLAPGMKGNGLVAGTPRPVRSDEWVLSTPIALSSVAQDFPADAWIGLNRVDQGAAPHAGPTRDWTTLFKPQDWGYLVLGKSRGLAVSWWWPFAISLIGCFALLGLVTRRWYVSAVLAVAATFTPYAGWWSSPPPTLSIGYCALTGAALLAAWSVRSRRWAATWAVGAAVAGFAFALALYPPWQLSLAWVIAAVCVGQALDARVGWRRLLWPLAVSGGVAGALVGLWYAQHREAISAQAATYYPGHRISLPGTGSLRVLLDAPVNFWMTGKAGTTMGLDGRGGPYANLSEAASSWVPLAVGLLIVVGFAQLAVGRWRPDLRWRPGASDPDSPAAPIWTAGLVAAAVLLLLAWTFWPVPTWVGRVTLLQRVQPVRTSLAIGLGLVVLIGCAAAVRGRRPSAWSWPWLLLAAAVTGLISVWADRGLPWNAGLTPTVLVAGSGVLMGAAFAGLAHARAAAVAGVILCAYTVVSWALINPLQHGVAPITHDPLVRKLRHVTKGSPNPRVAVFTELRSNYPTVAKVRGAGLQSITGTTPYPDTGLMSRLVPGQKNLWNNYAQYRWAVEPAGTAPFIVQLKGTSMELHLPVCQPLVLDAGRPGWVVADRALHEPCLIRIGRVAESNGQRFWIYRVRS